MYIMSYIIHLHMMSLHIIVYHIVSQHIISYNIISRHPHPHPTPDTPDVGSCAARFKRKNDFRKKMPPNTKTVR